MLAIFGFRKNRNQTLSSQGPESEAELLGDGCHTVATAPTGTALENVYTLLQPPRPAARVGSPIKGSDGKTNDYQGKSSLVSPPPVPSIPHAGKHPFYSPREISDVDAVFEQPVEMDKYWADDKQRATEVLQADKEWMMEARPGEDYQWFDERMKDRTFGEFRITDRQAEKYWTESRHMEKQWTVDRHTQRQIDRKMERQWMGGRQMERSWSESKQMDVQVDSQWMESRQLSRKTDRPVKPLHLGQKPLPPYPSDRTPSPKQEGEPPKKEVAAVDWSPQNTDGHKSGSPVAGGGPAEGWRSSAGGGVSRVCASKPEPPPQSSKPNLSKLRQRHRRESSDALPEEDGDEGTDCERVERKEKEKQQGSEGPPLSAPEKYPSQPKSSSHFIFPKESEWDLPPPPVPPPVNKHALPDRAASQGDEGLRPQAPVKPQRNRKAMSCDAESIHSPPDHSELL